MSISAKPEEKPTLDAECFQRLLAAAFVMQSQNGLGKEVAAFEAQMMGMSLRRVAPLFAKTSYPLVAKVRTTHSNMPPRPGVLGASATDVATIKSRRPINDRDADRVAKNIVVRYAKTSQNLPNNRPLKDLKHRRSNNAGLDASVRYTFGKDTAALAADTLVRYGARIAAVANPIRLQGRLLRNHILQRNSSRHSLVLPLRKRTGPAKPHEMYTQGAVSPPSPNLP